MPRRLTASLLAAAALLTAPADSASAARCADHNPLRNPYVGELHVHTAFSFDSVLFGVSAGPREAYRFAQGAPLTLVPTDLAPPTIAQLQRPLDFAAVTDHSEFFGEFNICLIESIDPDLSDGIGYDSRLCTDYRSLASANQSVATINPNRLFALSVFINFALPLLSPFPMRNAQICGPDPAATCLPQAAMVWDETQAAAQEFNAPCEFTTFNAYEWTANTLSPLSPSGSNLHRNVIFRNASVPDEPTSYIDAPRVELLWGSLVSECIEGDPECDVLTIPHNSNLSAGRAFAPVNSTTGAPLSVEDAALRASIEPVAEIHQHKGSSECKPGVLTNDELCGFESYDRIGVLDPPDPNGQTPALSFVRNGLKEGLRQEQLLGLNPFKVGILAATDSHNAIPGAAREDEYGRDGHQGANDWSPPRILNVQNGTGIESNGGGLAVVWAEENTRDALFDAIRRKEVYGTSGTRPIVRFFGGWDLDRNLCGKGNAIQKADRRGVPMGSELPARSAKKSKQKKNKKDKKNKKGGKGKKNKKTRSKKGRSEAPRFLVSALQDPGPPGEPGTPLQRIQIVKGWLDENGDTQESVVDVAGDPDNGATVDLATCEPRGDGFAELCTVWEDPDFDPAQRAFYYARILENPTCRWSQQLCIDTLSALGLGCADPEPVFRAGLGQCCSDTAASQRFCSSQLPPNACDNPDTGVPDNLQYCCTGDFIAFPRTVQERAWTSPIWYRPEAGDDDGDSHSDPD